MDDVDQSDDLTFKVNFGSDGVAKLRDRVKEKLKEFMGDYTDDTLVEYVIVLLKNGRRKIEARNELNVFLGDDSDSFVSWLWDHLRSNLDLYVQNQGVSANETVSTKSMSIVQAEKIDYHLLDSETEREKPNKLSRSRHGREWKGLVKIPNAPPTLRSTVTTNFHMEEDFHQKLDQVKRSPSPLPKIQRKRSRPDERAQMEREEVPRTMINAPRRLLQFAVRDAVGSPRTSSLGAEPSLKRLRSVVSTATGDSSLPNCSQRIRSVAIVPNASMAVAIKAVAEASKDVLRVRSSGNVFDRLGRSRNVPDTTDDMEDFRNTLVEDVEEYQDYEHIAGGRQTANLQRNDRSERYARNQSVLDSDAGIAPDLVSDNEVYEGSNSLSCRAMNVSHTDTSAGNNNDDSLMMQYRVSNKTDVSMRNEQKDQNHLSAATTPSKIVNISVNLNTWKPPHYMETREISEMDGLKSVQDREAGADRSGVRLMKENNHPLSVGNRNALSAADGEKESQKIPSSTGLYSSGRPAEDADSRTIFVGNVHFAATKDSLSRHFNKFGDVLKVVILMDGATGQPKGSAYVEFMRKEAADYALTLDGTSFMSRILKVVKKSAAPEEASSVVPWPRIARGSIVAASRFGRIPFPRGMLGLYRSRVPMKVGARSLQWKRDAQISPTETTGPPPSTPRSLTYVRADPNASANYGTV